MPSSAKFTIDGFPCLASTVERWHLTSGTAPFVAEFDMIPEDADALFEGELEPLTLKIANGDDGESIEVRNLYAIEKTPGPVPADRITRVKVADRRWFWSRKHIRRSYNIRRRVGHKRVIGDGTRETTLTAQSLWYQPWSVLPDLRPYAARDILQDVIQEVSTVETQFSSSTNDNEPGQVSTGLAPIEIREEIQTINGLNQSEQPIEGLKLDDAGDAAINRVLSFLPGASLYIDLDGKVVVYSQASSNETDQIDDLPPFSTDIGVIEKIDRRRVRPSEIHVLFTREVELRQDTIELDVGATSDIFGTDRRFMENVLPVPDYQLTLVNGDTVARGTWITFSEALRAWGPHPRAGDITFDLIRRAAVPFLDLWGALAESGKRDPDNDWAARIAAIQTHWRTTYRINRRWTDRVSQWKAFRVGIVDPTRGTRSPAIAYGNHAFIPGQRFMIAEASGNHDLSYAINVQGFNDGSTPPKLQPEDKPAAKMSIIDSDQGIVQIDWSVDPSRPFSAVLPGWVQDGSGGSGDITRPSIPGPSADLTDRTRAITFDSVTSRGARPAQMTAEHRAAVILTAIPATSVSNSELERVVVRPPDVDHLLPERARGMESTGPILEIRVRPQTLTAIVPWSDDDADVIEAAFGVGGAVLSDSDSALTSLILNYDGVAGGRGSMASVSRALAARAWAAMADRHMGTAAVPLRADARPEGWLDTVAFQVTPDGRVETVYALPGDVPQVDMFGYLDRGTRDVMLELATLGRA